MSRTGTVFINLLWNLVPITHIYPTSIINTIIRAFRWSCPWNHSCPPVSSHKLRSEEMSFRLRVLKDSSFQAVSILHAFIKHNPGESIGLKFIPSQSELFRFIPKSVSEPVRIILNQSEKCFVSRFMKIGQKSIRMNPKSCFQSRSIRINLISDWSKPNF